MRKPIMYLIVVFGSMLPGKLRAQLNLVLNGGLEQRDTCPWAADQIKIANYWSCIDTAYTSSLVSYAGDPNCSPEYINTCSVWSAASAPNNPAFVYQYPHGGNGMADVCMYNNDSIATNYRRDYLMGRLSNTLTAGQSYCVTFYVVMANGAAYAINNIGAYLDDGSIDTNNHCGWEQTEYTPQVLETTIINDTLNWIKVQGSFIANGTEKYITIGNFADTAHTSKLRRNSGHASMYEVDDVSVIASNATAYAGPDVTITAGSSVYIGAASNGDGMPCYWYAGGEPAPIDSGGTILVHPTDTTTYIVAMDLCGVITYDTVTVNVVPCTGPPVAAFTDTGSHIVGFTYTGTTTGVDSVRWTFGDGSGSTATDPMHTYSASGTYSVCVTVYAGCGVDTFCQSVAVVVPNLGAASAAPLGMTSLNIWPNPAGVELHIDGALGSEVTLYDMVGRIVATLSVLANSDMMNIAGLTSGIYVIELKNKTTGYRVIRRIEKE